MEHRDDYEENTNKYRDIVIVWPGKVWLSAEIIHAMSLWDQIHHVVVIWDEQDTREEVSLEALVAMKTKEVWEVLEMAKINDDIIIREVKHESKQKTQNHKKLTSLHKSFTTKPKQSFSKNFSSRKR